MKKIVILGVAALATLSLSAQSLQDAVKLSDKEQFEKATSMFKQVLSTEPQNGEAWFQMGENYFASERTDSAAYCYHRGAEVNPRFPLNHAGVGKVLWTTGKQDEARAQFDKAIATALDKANKFGKPVQARTYREVAQGCSEGKQKDLVKAQELIAKALALDPNDPETYILKGNVLFEANPRDGSAPLENYKKAAELDGLNAKPISKKAFMYYRAKNYAASIEEYTKAIAVDPLYAPAYSGRAEANFMAKQYDPATADMNKYLELNSGSRAARVRYAKFLFLSKKYDECLKEVNALRTTGTTDATLKRVEGYSFTELGQFENAKAAMDDYFMEQDPEKVIATDYEYMGKIYAGLAAKAGAGTMPADYDSLSCAMCVQAALMDPTKDYLYVEAAKLYVKSKKYDKAIATMRTKMAMGKPETNDYYYLGDAALKGKRYANADSAWATYIERNPNAYQGYKFRARTQAGMDSTENKTFAAKPFYEDMLKKMKPEEMDKNKADLEEAYNYLGLYHLYSPTGKDLPRSRCFFEKVKALNVGSNLTKQVNEVMLISKELKDVAPGSCD
jgi:tetratricopeptide (TPR) repeat protein